MKYSIQKLSKQRPIRKPLSQVAKYSCFIFTILRLIAICPSLSAEIYLHSAKEALDIASVFNEEYKLQEKYLSESVRLAKKSVGAFLPSFDFSWSENDTVPKGADDQRIKTISAGITQKVFDGGKSIMEYRMQVNAGKLELYNFKQTFQSFQGEVARSYYENLAAIEKCRAQSDAVQNAQTVLEIAKVQYEQGLITQSDYVSTEISFAKMQLQLKSLEDKRAASYREFVLLLGIDSKERIVFCREEELLQRKKTEHIEERKEEFIKAALENSIDLKKISLEIDWAKKQRALQKTVFLPSISLNASVDFSGRRYPLTTPSYTLKAIVGFENNPWLPTNISGTSGFKEGRMNSMNSSVSGQGVINTTYFSQIRMSKINLSQKALSRDKTIREIENSVASLLESIEQNAKSIELNFETLSLCKEKVELQKLQLEQGMITEKDFLDTLSECAEQEIQVLELRNQQSHLQTQLEILTGIKTGGHE